MPYVAPPEPDVEIKHEPIPPAPDPVFDYAVLDDQPRDVPNDAAGEYLFVQLDELTGRFRILSGWEIYMDHVTLEGNLNYRRVYRLRLMRAGDQGYARRGLRPGFLYFEKDGVRHEFPQAEANAFSSLRDVSVWIEEQRPIFAAFERHAYENPERWIPYVGPTDYNWSALDHHLYRNIEVERFVDLIDNLTRPKYSPIIGYRFRMNRTPDERSLVGTPRFSYSLEPIRHSRMYTATDYDIFSRWFYRSQEKQDLDYFTQRLIMQWRPTGSQIGMLRASFEHTLSRHLLVLEVLQSGAYFEHLATGQYNSFPGINWVNEQ